MHLRDASYSQRQSPTSPQTGLSLYRTCQNILYIFTFFEGRNLSNRKFEFGLRLPFPLGWAIDSGIGLHTLLFRFSNDLNFSRFLKSDRWRSRKVQPQLAGAVSNMISRKMLNLGPQGTESDFCIIIKQIKRKYHAPQIRHEQPLKSTPSAKKRRKRRNEPKNGNSVD